MALAAGVASLGYMQTCAFNALLGRTPPFDRESPAVWVQSGLQSLFLPTLYFVGFFVVLWGTRFVLRVLRLSRKVDHLMTDGATKTVSLSRRLGLDDPAVFGQAVAGVGLIAFAVVFTDPSVPADLDEAVDRLRPSDSRSSRAGRVSAYRFKSARWCCCSIRRGDCAHPASAARQSICRGGGARYSFGDGAGHAAPRPGVLPRPSQGRDALARWSPASALRRRNEHANPIHCPDRCRRNRVEQPGPVHSQTRCYREHLDFLVP